MPHVLDGIGSPSQSAAMGDSDPERGLLDTLRLLQQVQASPLIPQGNPLAQIAGSLAAMSGGIAGGLTGQPNPYFTEMRKQQEQKIGALLTQARVAQVMQSMQQARQRQAVEQQRLQMEGDRVQIERERLGLTKAQALRAERKEARDEEWRMDESVLTLATKGIEHESPSVRQNYAQNIATIYAKRGYPMPPEYVSSLTAAKPDKTLGLNIYREILEGIPLDQIARNLGTTVGRVQSIASAVTTKNDRLLEAWGIPGFESEEAKKIELDLRKAQVMKTRAETVKLVLETEELGKKPKPDPETTARKEFTSFPPVDRFVKTQEAFRRVNVAAMDNTGAGAISLVFNFIKMIDPGSTVSPGEQATAINAAAVPDRIRNLYNRLMSGDNLPPETRKDFLNQARLMYREALSQYEGIETEYTRIAKEKGLNVGQVVPDLVGKFRGFTPSGVTALAPPRVPSLADAQREFQRLTQSGLSQLDAINAMKKKGWPVGPNAGVK